MTRTYLVIGILVGVVVGMVAAMLIMNVSPDAYAQNAGAAASMTAVTGASFDKGDYLYVLDAKTQTVLCYNPTMAGDGFILLGARYIGDDLKVRDYINKKRDYVKVEDVSKLFNK